MGRMDLPSGLRVPQQPISCPYPSDVSGLSAKIWCRAFLRGLFVVVESRVLAGGATDNQTPIRFCSSLGHGNVKLGNLKP